MQKLITEVAAGRIRSTVDNGVHSLSGPFVGVEGIYDAVEVSAHTKNYNTSIYFL